MSQSSELDGCGRSLGDRARRCWGSGLDEVEQVGVELVFVGGEQAVGAPGYTFRVASLTSSTDRRAEASMGTIWSSSAGPRAAVRRPAIGSLLEHPLSDPPTAGTTLPA